MRGKRAKQLKREVAFKMYVGDGVTWDDVKKDKNSVYSSSDFKPVYRAKKKNYMKTETHPKCMDNQKFDPVNQKLFLHRTRKRKAA